MTTPTLLQKGLLATFTLALTSLSSTPAQAATLTFDDLIATDFSYLNHSAPVPTNYAGFSWNEFFYDANPPGGGYTNGTVSQSTILFNNFASPATFSRDQTFDFNSAYLTAAWNTGLNIRVEGFVGSTQTYNRTVVVNPDRPTLFNFDFLGVDRVLFTSFGGRDYSTWDGADSAITVNFVLDNLTFSNLATAQPPTTDAVPEPTTMLGLALAGAGLAAVRRGRDFAAKG